MQHPHLKCQSCFIFCKKIITVCRSRKSTNTFGRSKTGRFNPEEFDQNLDSMKTHLHSALVSACFGVVVVVVTVVAERTGSWLRLNFSLATSQHSSFSRSLWIIFQISGRVASSSVVKKFSRWSFFFCETAFQILKMRNFFCKVHIRICFERERRLNYQFIF